MHASGLVPRLPNLRRDVFFTLPRGKTEETKCRGQNIQNDNSAATVYWEGTPILTLFLSLPPPLSLSRFRFHFLHALENGENNYKNASNTLHQRAAFGFKSEMGGQEHTTQRTRDRSCLLYTSPSPRDQRGSRMPSSA